MQLPGQLKNTTLGDLLGALFRERASGVLELIEPSGQRHHVELREGKVEHVETDRGGPLLGDLLGLSNLPALRDQQRLGEVLLAEGRVDHDELSSALKRQTIARLERLFDLEKAAVRFHAPRPGQDDPTAPAPLVSREFLHGRPRHRGRPGARMLPVSRQGDGALAVLGLEEGATREDIRKAFRELAQEHHPDRHPHADEATRQRLFRRFAEISRAYHALTS
jgi:DnaJ-domain-containing protein 1